MLHTLPVFSLYFSNSIVVGTTSAGNNGPVAARPDQVDDFSAAGYAHNLTPWSAQVTTETQALTGLTTMMRQELNAISKKRIVTLFFIAFLFRMSVVLSPVKSTHLSTHLSFLPSFYLKFYFIFCFQNLHQQVCVVLLVTWTIA